MLLLLLLLLLLLPKSTLTCLSLAGAEAFLPTRNNTYVTSYSR